MLDRRRRDGPAEARDEHDAAIWLITTSDMSLLLLSCFVLLFSMSNPDSERFTESVGSVQKALAGAVGYGLPKVTDKEASSLVDQAALAKLVFDAQKKVYADVLLFSAGKGLDGVIGHHIDNGVITLRAPTNVLFEAGGGELTPKGVEMLKALKEFFIIHSDQRINIRGFTDDQPPPPGPWRDNWDLSAARAVNVLRWFLAQGLAPNRFSATGLADFEPVAPNTNAENRAKNRRVEFVLEKQIGR